MPLESTPLPAFEDTEPVAQSAPLPAFHETEPHEDLPDFNDTQPLPDYGTPEQQTLSGVEGALRGATLGLSDVAETKLAGVKPEDIRGRQQENPWTSGLAAAAGGAGAAYATGGGSLLAEGLGGGVLGGALGLGTEGAVFGAGNAISDAALGDPDLNAQKIMSHIGWGAVLGSGLGALAGKLGAFGEQAGEALARSEDLAAPIEGGEPTLTGYESPKNSPPVKSFDDLQNRIAKAQASGLTFELPQKQVLVQALSQLPDLENPALPQQIESLNSKGDLDNYRIAFREGDSDVAKSVQNYEAIQKAELVGKTASTIDSLSPAVVPTADPVTGGSRAIDAFTEQYQAEKKALVPMFQALDKVDLGPLRADVVPLMEALSNKIPAVARMFEFGEDGLPKSVASFDPKWGLSRAAYNSVKSVFESLESGAEEPASFQDLLNLRGNMDEHVNILAKDQGPSQIRGLKAAFMDYMQNLADDHIPDANLRDTFKRYAMNEQNRQVIERTFGANVGAQDLSFMPKNATEDILGKMFRDTSTVKAAKRILPPQKFDELLASHLAVVKNGFTKNGVFSSNNFLNYLRRHSAELGEAFSHRPDVLNRLKNLSTFSTIIPDSASINPSGSAKTMLGLIKNLSLGELGVGVLNPKILVGILGKRAMDMLRESQAAKSAVAEFNSGLLGKSAKQESLQATQKILGVVNANLDRAAKSIFKEPANAQ